MITFGSLFSGIGGIDLGFERAGLKCLWQVENDPFCMLVLGKHWPSVKRYGDIRDVKGKDIEPVDVVVGGLPCQPHSVAGERRAGDDERDMWPEFYRIICEISPRWVMAENVRGILSSEHGRFFGGILRDLASIGYNVTWKVLQARDFGALHRRERVFIVANRDSKRIEGFWKEPIPRLGEFSWCKDVRGIEDLRGRSDIPEPLVCRGGNGIRRRLDTVGNAVIPGIAQYIGKLIVGADGSFHPTIGEST